MSDLSDYKRMVSGPHARRQAQKIRELRAELEATREALAERDTLAAKDEALEWADGYLSALDDEGARAVRRKIAQAMNTTRKAGEMTAPIIENAQQLVADLEALGHTEAAAIVAERIVYAPSDEITPEMRERMEVPAVSTEQINAWCVTHADDFLALLRRAHNGEDPGLLLAEWWANTEGLDDD